MFAMNIKKAVTGDLGQLVAFDTVTRGLDQRITEIKSAIIQGRCWMFGDRGTPGGYAIMQDDFMGRPFVRFVYVATDQRRRGIASKLILHLESVCGQDRMFTATTQSNEGMRILLDKLGYQQCGEIHGIDDAEPEMIFIKRLQV